MSWCRSTDIETRFAPILNATVVGQPKQDDDHTVRIIFPGTACGPLAAVSSSLPPEIHKATDRPTFSACRAPVSRKHYIENNSQERGG
jgi:hypothetical protein